MTTHPAIDLLQQNLLTLLLVKGQGLNVMKLYWWSRDKVGHYGGYAGLSPG